MNSLLVIALFTFAEPAVRPAPAQAQADPATALQNAIDAATGPTTHYLRKGQTWYSRPVFRGKSGQTILGAGLGETIISTMGAFPWLVDGVSAAATDGFVIGRGARPDAYRVLDATVAGQPKTVWGFDTQARSIPYLPAHGLCLGRLTPEGWDYFGTVDAFTLRVCLGPSGASGRLPQSGAVLGCGGFIESNVPTPYVFGFLPDSAPGHGTAFFGTRWQGDAPGISHIKSFDYGDPKKVHRFLIGADAKAASPWFASVDGRAVTLNKGKAGDDDVKGKTLERSNQDTPFQIGIPSSISYCGSGASAPDFVLYGLSLHAAAIPIDPPDDRTRYLDATGHCLGVFRPDSLEPGRLLRFDNGAEAGGQQGRAIVLDSLRGFATLENLRTADLTVFSGAPAELAGVCYGQTLERVRFVNGVQGFSHIRMGGGSYPFMLRDSTFGGSDSALSFFGAIGSGQNLALSQGGTTSLRSTATSFDGQGLILTGFARRPDTGFAILCGSGYGGQSRLKSVFGLSSLKGVIGDNENGNTFHNAFIYCEQSTYSPTLLTLENIAVQDLAPGASFVRLVGHKPGAAYRIKPILDARGCMVPNGCKSAVQIDGDAGIWVGSFSTISNTANITGPGAGGVKVVSP